MKTCSQVYSVSSLLPPWPVVHQLKVAENNGVNKKNFLAQNCEYCLTHQIKHLFWVLKRTVSLRRFFWVPQHMLWSRNKKICFSYTLLSGCLITMYLLFITTFLLCWSKIYGLAHGNSVLIASASMKAQASLHIIARAFAAHIHN